MDEGGSQAIRWLRSAMHHEWTLTFGREPDLRGWGRQSVFRRGACDRVRPLRKPQIPRQTNSISGCLASASKLGGSMARQRPLEILCADAVRKAVSARYAPGTDDRVLQFLADRGAVPMLVQQYNRGGDLDRLCLDYWNSMLEPDALRLEDLVSALLISFATSFAASLLIEGGKAGFPALFKRIGGGRKIEASLRDLASLEQRRREHLQTLMSLLDRKADAVRTSQADFQRELSAIRAHLAEGQSLAEQAEALALSRDDIDLRPVEIVVRGMLLTEEQRENGLKINGQPEPGLVVHGLPLSIYFGTGQIVQSKIEALERLDYYTKGYDDLESLLHDLRAPLRDAARHHHLKNYLGRPPKKILPVGDSDLRQLLDNPHMFDFCRPLIGALVVRYGGMTCHTAVLSRSLAIPCIQLGDDFMRLKDYQFAAIQNGEALLFQTLPDELHRFL